MGSCVSSETEGLAFHPHTRGSNISLSDCKCRAQRNHSFHGGLVFSNRPLRPHERVWIQILQDVQRWHGALRLGITTVDPNSLDPALLPPFACPNLTILPGFWAIGIPEQLCKAGTVLSFWLDRNGKVFFQREDDPMPRVLFLSIPKKTPVWAMFDVYGKTQAIHLLGSSRKCKPQSTICSCCPDKAPHTQDNHRQLPSKTPTTSQDHLTDKHVPSVNQNFSLSLDDDATCVICQDNPPDTMLLPCCHGSFCYGCVQKVQRENAKCPLCRHEILFLYQNCSSHQTTTPG